MSETFDTTIIGYAEPLRNEVAAAAGLAAAVRNSALLALDATNFLYDIGAAAGVAHRATAGATTATTDFAILRASLAAIETRQELSLLHAATSSNAAAPLAEARRAVDRAGEALRYTPFAGAALDSQMRPVIAAGVKSLIEAVGVGSARLISAERRVLSQAVEGALRDVGYRAERATPFSDGRTVFKGIGERGVEVYVEIDAKSGHIVADLDGCTGTACELKRDEFLRALGARGVAVRLAQRQLHGREKGSLATRLAPLFSRGSVDGEYARRAATRQQHGRPGRQR